MAKVTITITDNEGSADGLLHVSIESDPPFPGPANENQDMTSAQILGWVGMDAITERCGASGSDADEDDE